MKFLKHWGIGAALVAAMIASILLVGCAGGMSTSPEIRWAQAQSAYNAAVGQAVAARKPCVVYGEDAPDCLIKAADYPRVDFAIKRGGALVDAVGNGAPAQSTADALLAVAAEIVAAIPVKR